MDKMFDIIKNVMLMGNTSDDDSYEYQDSQGDPKGGIDSSKVKRAVYNRIDFPLPESTWEVIDHAFGDCWNNIIGMGGDIYFDKIFDFVDKRLKENRLLLLSNNLARILTIMLDYIEMTGGFLDDPRCPNHDKPVIKTRPALEKEITLPASCLSESPQSRQKHLEANN